MTKKTDEVVGFVFQEIPLEEAVNVVLAGDGSYSEVKQMLLQKLPTLEHGKAFAFGLPGGKEVPEDQRRGLCMAINSTLKKAKVNWKITYSGVKKLFICVPKILSKMSVKVDAPKPELLNTSDLQNIKDLKAKGLSVKAISEKTGISVGRVNYLLYDPKANPKPVPVQRKLQGATAAQDLVQLARIVFNYQDDFKNPMSKPYRKAISVVGVNDLNISPKELGALIGISADGVYFNARSKSGYAASEIKILQKAIKEN